MIKKILFLTAVLSVIAGCSTAPSRPAGTSEESGSPTAAAAGGGSGSFDMGGDASANGSPTTTAPKQVNPVAAAQASKDVSQNGLVDAIKSQNDEQIFRVSGQLLMQNPNNVQALNAMAMYYFKKGKIDAAKFLLAKALAANPNAGEAYSNRGLIHLIENENREAIQDFHKALELNPNDGVAAANAGSIYVQQKDYNKAISVLEVATSHGIRDVKTMTNYGVALTASGKFDEAAATYEAAMKDSNNNRELLLNYAILLIDHLNKNKEGMEILNRLKFIGPPSESRNRIIALENKAKAGLK